ncbi:MAG: alpha/beta fold hydrolase [Solirubrobacteraceae bacterium]
MAGIEIGGFTLDGSVAGAGPPLLFLHGGDYVAQNAAFLDRLAGSWRVTAPRHPGFGRSERPAGFRTIHDLAYLYLDWLDRQPGGDVVLVGSSLGGWVALEICVRSVARIGRLVLIDPVGVKFGGREDRDIADIYALPEDERQRRTFHHPERALPDYAALDEDELTAIARDRSATALYGWRPYMHDPGLRQWLHRVRVPALVLWGESDGIVSVDYGEKLCRSLPDARLERVARTGHYPQVEQPDAVAAAIERFASTEARR